MSERTRVVVTGLGAVTAAGHGHAALWDAVQRGGRLFRPITRFEPRPGEPRLGAQVSDFLPEQWLPAAIVRQTDISTQFGFASARLALEDAKLRLEDVDRQRVGVIVGHAFGGMDYAERELYNQCVLGPAEVGPYQAIAWFYAAAMGQLSIQLGLHGYSKAFVADRCSGMHALGHAFRIIQSGRADACLAGGVEAPFSPFMYRVVVSVGQVSNVDYSPFARSASGFILGEGGCILLLESLEHARRRGAPVYAELVGYAATTDPDAGQGLSSAADLERCQTLALRDARLTSVDHVIADGAASLDADGSELIALARLVRSDTLCRISAPKAVVGELYGAGAPVQALAGALSIQRNVCLPLLESSRALRREPYAPPHVTQPTEQEIGSVLINSRAVGGVNASLVLKRLTSEMADTDRPRMRPATKPRTRAVPRKE